LVAARLRRVDPSEYNYWVKEIPDSSIQDAKKRFGDLCIVFIGIRAVTGFREGNGALAEGRFSVDK
jgi:hypothetical protein